MEQSKKTERFIIWWVAIWYNLLPAIFFISWYFCSTYIAIAMPKANGEPHEDIGMFFGIFPSFIVMMLAKIFIYDKILIKKLESGCSPK